MDDLPLFVEVQHHPDAVSSLVDLLDVVLPWDFPDLSEHVLHLSSLPLRETLLPARRRISRQCADKMNAFQPDVTFHYESPSEVYRFMWFGEILWPRNSISTTDENIMSYNMLLQYWWQNVHTYDIYIYDRIISPKKYCKIGLKLNSKKGILLFKLHIYIRLPVNKQLIYPSRPSTHLIGWSSYVAQCWNSA